MKLSFSRFFFSICLVLSCFNLIPGIGLRPVSADFSTLTPCENSPSFQKRSLTAVKKLENRLKLYATDSQEADALKKQIEHTKARFQRYADSNLLCGKDGLPHLITTGQWDHAQDFVFPGILFLYITGWIGWVGRKYLHYASTTENAFESEIVLNVPVALSIMTSGFFWPIDAWKEFKNQDLLASDEDVTVSPR